MLVKKHTRTNFMPTWSIPTIRKSKDRFHQNFVVGLKVHFLTCRGVNLEQEHNEKQRQLQWHK
jgi:hypothetical protein